MSSSEKAHQKPVFSKIVFAIVILIGAFFALLVPLPFRGRAATALGDLLHAPCFAILAIILYAVLRPYVGRQTMALAIGCWIFLCGFGYVMEVLQEMGERNKSTGDVIANVIGVTAGLLMVTQFSAMGKRRILGTVTGSAFVLLPMIHPALILADEFMARRDFPRLASFEQPLELWRWHSKHIPLSRVRRHATHGNWSLQAELAPDDYQSMSHTISQRDWSEYDQLVFDLGVAAVKQQFVPGHKCRIVLKVGDVRSEGVRADRYEKRFRPNAGVTEIRIPLREIEAGPVKRSLNLSRLRRLTIAVTKLNQPMILYLDNMRLE